MDHTPITHDWLIEQLRANWERGTDKNNIADMFVELDEFDAEQSADIYERWEDDPDLFEPIEDEAEHDPADDDGDNWQDMQARDEAADDEGMADYQGDADIDALIEEQERQVYERERRQAFDD
jgi:hypothetical protein